MKIRTDKLLDAVLGIVDHAFMDEVTGLAYDQRSLEPHMQISGDALVIAAAVLALADAVRCLKPEVTE